VLLATYNFRPERLFLRGVQEHALIACVLFPGCGDETCPCMNDRRGPGHCAFRTTAAVERHLQGACGSFARCDYESATANPIVDLRVTRRLHACVIRCPGWTALSARPLEIAVVNWGVSRRLFAFSLLVVVLAGCHPGHQNSSATEASSSFKIYKLRGKVVSTNAGTGEVTLDHEAIPGFMDAMTMPYKLKDASILSELHPGDVITADLLVSQNADADVLLDHIVVVAQGKPDYKPAVIYHVPAPGDTVQDFALRNQDGRLIHLDQFRGKELLITFIYTRCPLPDFCPRVTHHFAAIEKQLAADPALNARTHLLSVSFDPEHDTPERLRAYGAQYIGSDAKGAFAHWDFAVPQKPVLLEMAKYFDLGMTAGPDESITHTLSTTLIGRDGKVVRFYPGNEWTPEEVMADVKQAAGK